MSEKQFGEGIINAGTIVKIRGIPYELKADVKAVGAIFPPLRGIPAEQAQKQEVQYDGIATVPAGTVLKVGGGSYVLKKDTSMFGSKVSFETEISPEHLAPAGMLESSDPRLCPASPQSEPPEREHESPQEPRHEATSHGSETVPENYPSDPYKSEST